MAVAADPLQLIRSQVEDIAGDPGLDASEKALKLQHFADELTDVQGLVARHLGDAQLAQEAGATGAMRARLRARQNASIREALLSRGLATPEQLDELGYLSHGHLDQLDEEGLLEATLEELSETRAELFRVTPTAERSDLLTQLAFGGDALEAVERLQEIGYTLHGEPSPGEAIVLTKDQDRLVVTFAEGDALVVESVEHS